MFSFAVVSSSVQSTRLNHLVCRDNGKEKRGRESKRGSKRWRRSEEIRRGENERNKGEKNGRVGGGEWSRIIIVL